jgi:hypothetical protein
MVVEEEEEEDGKNDGKTTRMKTMMSGPQALINPLNGDQ